MDALPIQEETGAPFRPGPVGRGKAAARVDLEGWHYVLLTGAEGGSIRLFDPYRITKAPFPVPDVRTDDAHPETYNRIVPAAWMESEDIEPYAFGPEEEREAVLLFNAGTELTAEKTVEYMI